MADVSARGNLLKVTEATSTRELNDGNFINSFGFKVAKLPFSF